MIRSVVYALVIARSLERIGVYVNAFIAFAVPSIGPSNDLVAVPLMNAFFPFKAIFKPSGCIVNLRLTQVQRSILNGQQGSLTRSSS